MEGGPQIRIVGNADQEQKENIKRALELRFFEHANFLPKDVKEVMKFERQKSEIENSLIDFANKETNELLDSLGIDIYDIPRGNYHIVPAEVFEIATGKSNAFATALPGLQGILFNSDVFYKDPLYFGSIALHETLHLKSPISIEVSKNKEGIEVSLFRAGVSVMGSQKSDSEEKYLEHFEGLEEAIVATQEKKSFTKILELPSLSKEKDSMTTSYLKEFRKHIASKENIPEDDIISIDANGSYRRFSYLPQRRVLGYICEEIQKQFSHEYQDTEAVFRVFLKAHFTGQLLPIARLVEKTFGEETFRLLGEMGTSDESAISCLEALKEKKVKRGE